MDEPKLLTYRDLREPPNYNKAATGLLGPRKGPPVLTQAPAPPGALGPGPQTTGYP